MTVLVGTASWTDKTLIDCGCFYPPDCKTPEARLRFYASRFPMAEVDSSYYGIPTPHNAQGWAERTPPGYVFNVKAFRLFTGHPTEPKFLGKDIVAMLPQALQHKRTLYYRDLVNGAPEVLDELWRRFYLGLQPLRDAGKLKAVLFQFAPWLLPNAESEAHIRECVDRMQDYLLAAEFRHRAWFNHHNTERTLALEEELGLVHVVVDAPEVETHNAVPMVWRTTSSQLAIVRLHGKNHETWNVKGATSASDRFNYDYSREELAKFVPDIRRLEKLVEMVQVIFNNNMEDQGQRNAKTLMDLLAG